MLQLNHLIGFGGAAAIAAGNSAIKKVQFVSITHTSSGSEGAETGTTQSITPVNDITRTSIHLLGCSTSGTTIPSTGFVRVELTDADTVTAYHANPNAAVTIINAAVVEWDPEYVDKVEHGMIPLEDLTTNTATLGSSFDTDYTAVLLLGLTGTDDHRNYPVLDLVNATTVSATNTTLTSKELNVGFCAIQFNSAKMSAPVQELNFNLDNKNSTTTSVTVDASKTVLFFAGMRFLDAGNNISASALPRISLNSGGTTVTAQNGGGTNSNIVDTNRCRVYMVQFLDGIKVQRGSAAFGAAEATRDNTVNSVDTTKAFPNFLGVTRNGVTPDNLWVNYYTRVALQSATSVRQVRNTAADTSCQPSWELISAP